MKKFTCLILVLLLIACNAPFVFAEDGGAMKFSDDEIQLSLAAAENMMLTSGAAYETAQFNLKSNKAKTRSYYENVDDLYSMKDYGLQASKSQRALVDALATFAQTQTQRNYDAEMNQITRDTVSTYYQLAQAKEALRISNDNVAVQEKLYQNTQSKFNLGVVSKQDVLNAEIGLNEAKVNAEKMENTYASARMGFNLSFGYDLMQNINITDTLDEAEMCATPLEDAIASALENRNEIKGAEFGLNTATLKVEANASKVSRTSAQYRSDEATLMNAQTNAVNAPKSIEMDVRNKYMDMVQKKSAVELGKLNVENAKETYRLANLQYDAGMATLTDTQQAQLGAYQAELNYYTTLLDYNLAIIDYEQSMTVGTKSIQF